MIFDVLHYEFPFIRVIIIKRYLKQLKIKEDEVLSTGDAQVLIDYINNYYSEFI